MTREQRKRARRRDFFIAVMAIALSVAASFVADWIMPVVI